MASEENNRGAFVIQQHYCARNAAPIYARITGAIAHGLDRETRTGARVLDWPGEPTRGALPLRLMGGLHALVRAGADDALAAVFAGAVVEQEAVERAVMAAVARHDAALLSWLDGPPQTNEPGRSAALIMGLLAVAAAFGPRMEILEIGSSAGLNLMIDRYRIDLGGTLVGPADASVSLTPDFAGPAPAAVPIEIMGIRGCDVQPLDATDPAVEARLSAFVWPEAPERQARLTAAIAMMRARGVRIDRADAADWLKARLAEPRPDGVTRVLMHSVVWQYLPEASAARIKAAMEAAGAKADADRPLAWVSMEPDRSLGHQVISMRGWPGHQTRVQLGIAHAHAAWIKSGNDVVLPAAIPLPQGAQARL